MLDSGRKTNMLFITLVLRPFYTAIGFVSVRLPGIVLRRVAIK